jgi:hypothetical protein
MLDTFALPQELKFNPILMPIEHDGVRLPASIGQKIVRDDTNEVLGIVKSRYTPQPYTALWEPLVEGLQESGLDLDDAEIEWSTMDNGARMFADITLKSYNYDAHLFNHMRKVSMERDTVQNFMSTKLCLTKTKTKVKVNDAWLGRMMVLWDTYSTQIGTNGYAFYNTLTHYGTHVDRDSLRGAEVGNRALRQEQDVQTLVRGDAFKRLINYDDFEQRLAA